MPWSAEELRERVGQRLGDAATAIRVELGDTLVEVPGARIVEVDLTAVDRSALARGGDAPRFEIVYQLFSLEKRHRLRVKAAVASEPPEIDSVVSVWPAANWMEREVWDLYGIRIAGHPDLRRILLCEEFEGHPLRKDFPKRGLQPSSAAGEGD